MRVDRLCWLPATGWSQPREDMTDAQLVLYFGSRSHVTSDALFNGLRRLFPHAVLAGNSTGGQIFNGAVTDTSATALVLKFDDTRVVAIDEFIADSEASFTVGRKIASRLVGKDLKGIFILSDGLRVNGSELVSGILAGAGPEITITGGLAGDGTEFASTVVGVDALPSPGHVAGIGFYGSRVVIRHGSCGGWDEFGPHRGITRSKANLLIELDGQPALDLYERYLGDDAADLPSSALLYPLLIRNPSNPSHAIVRSVMAVDRENRTLTFAGDMPQGWSAQLMRGYFDRLAAGAAEAARQAAAPPEPAGSDVAAIAISCIGRRILMGQNIVDEVAALEAQFDKAVTTVGFYSYGEISPHPASGRCELHNQTMTVTTITEGDCADAPVAA